MKTFQFKKISMKLMNWQLYQSTSLKYGPWIEMYLKYGPWIKMRTHIARAAVVHLNFRAVSTILVPVCTVPNSMDRTRRCNKVDAAGLYSSFRLNLLLLKGPISVIDDTHYELGTHIYDRHRRYVCCIYR